MKVISRSRTALATVAASFMLLALPSLAAAHPGTGPDLVRRSGQFVILHADGRDGLATRRGMLVDGQNRTPVRAPRDVWIEPGSRVRLEGTVQNGALVLGDTLTAVTELAPAQTTAGLSAAPSTETTAVVQFYFAGQSSGLPASPDVTMTSDPKSLRNYYLEQTYGDITFETTVFAPVTLTYSTPGAGACTNSKIYDWADQALTFNGLSEGQFEHFVYVFPTASTCPWAGIAELPGRHAWINGTFTVPVIAHELGHNLGVAHAGGLTCTSAGFPAPMGDACSIDRSHYALPQYADPFDAMGNAPVLRQMNMQHKLALGVVPPAAVATVGASGTYQLSPMETLTGAVQLLKVPKPGGGTYFIEYRRPIGVFDGQAGPAVTGVLIHTESPDLTDPNPSYRGDSDTALVDMHPDGGFPSTQWQNAAMSLGQVFNDPVRGIVIQNLAQDANGASLAITLPADTTPPSTPGRLSAVLSGTTVGLQWTAASDDRAVASYVVARDGASLGTTGGATFTDTAAAPGATVVYAVTAIDTAGNAGAAATISVTIPDTIAPSAPATVTAKVTRDGQVHIAWGASADNRGVTAYRVLRGGTGLAQADIRSFVDKAPRPGTGATVTYSVVAFDLVGNASPSGNAKPLRAALLRKLGASSLKAVRVKSGKRTLVRVRGTVSDVRARCWLRIGRVAWRACKTRANSSFSVDLPRRGMTPVTLSLRDSIGRVKTLTVRVR